MEVEVNEEEEEEEMAAFSDVEVDSGSEGDEMEEDEAPVVSNRTPPSVINDANWL